MRNLILIVCLVILSGCTGDFFSLESNSAGETFKLNKITGTVKKITPIGEIQISDADKASKMKKLEFPEYEIGSTSKYKAKLIVKPFGQTLSYKLTVSPYRESFLGSWMTTTVELADSEGFLIEEIVLKNNNFAGIQNEKGKKEYFVKTGKVVLTPEQISAISTWSPTWSGY